MGVLAAGCRPAVKVSRRIDEAGAWVVATVAAGCMNIQ